MNYYEYSLLTSNPASLQTHVWIQSIVVRELKIMNQVWPEHETRIMLLLAELELGIMKCRKALE